MANSDAATPKTTAKRHILFVLGPHRAGTSAITRSVNLCGAPMPARLLRPNRHNETGYWEPLDLPLIHDLFLDGVNLSWDSVEALPDAAFATRAATLAQHRIAAFLQTKLPDGPICVLKDPRLSRLFPLWKTPLREAGFAPIFVLALRDPADVSASLMLRDGMDSASSSALWLRHTLEAEQHSRGYPRAVVSYDRLLSDWRAELGAALHDLKLGWNLDAPQPAAALDAFLSKTQRHHKVETDPTAEPFAQLARRCFGVLDAGKIDDHAIAAGLASAAQDLMSLSSTAEKIRTAATPTPPHGRTPQPLDPRSVLFITLDSCRYDTFANATIPHIRSVGGHIHHAQAPSHFTYGSHMAMFVGFTPGNAALPEPYINPKFAKIFRLRNGTRAPFGSAAFEVTGRNIIDGFNRSGYRTLGTGALAWFNPTSPPGDTLTGDFHEFHYPGNIWSLQQQVDWTGDQLSRTDARPVFAFLNIGETHVPYWHDGADWDATDNPCVPFQQADRSPECASRQAACLEYADGVLRPLLERFHHATIVITADHGDCWGEDGIWEHGISHEKTLSVPLLYKINPTVDAQRRARDAQAPQSIDRPTLNANVIVQPSPDCVTTVLGREILGLNKITRQHFCLRDDEATLWTLLEMPTIMAQLRDSYAQHPQALANGSTAEMAAILLKWKGMGLVSLISVETNMTPSYVPAWRSGIAIAKMDGETAMFDRLTNCYHSAGATGSLIVDLIDGTHSAEDIITTLLERYDVDRATCEQGVLEFLHSCAEANLFAGDIG